MTALIASLIHWIPHFPPQIDLAQHAAQILMLHGYVTGRDFAYREVMTLNLFTPYLPAYISGALLTTVMPVVITVKLLWTLAAFGTVYTAVRLRRLFSDRDEYDWILLPGMYGVTFKWGLLTFLFAVPFGLYIVERWVRHLRAPRRGSGLFVSAALVPLFFAHSLVTAWVMMVCAAMLLPTGRTLAAIRDRIVRMLPLLSPLPVALLWFRSTRNVGQTHSDLTWDLSIRYSNFFAQWLGLDDLGLAILAGVALLAVLLASGATLNRDPVSCAPLVVTLLILLLGPNVVFGNAFTYNRFFTLLGPTLISALASTAVMSRRARATRFALPILAISSVLLMGVRATAFAREQADFRRALKIMAPGRRTLSVVQEPSSKALGGSLEYLHFPVWYQSEKGGLVEPNFATYLPMIVRFRTREDAAAPFEFEARPRIDDVAHLERFQYVVVRGATGEMPQLGARRLDLLAHEGQWWVFSVPGQPDSRPSSSAAWKQGEGGDELHR